MKRKLVVQLANPTDAAVLAKRLESLGFDVGGKECRSLPGVLHVLDERTLGTGLEIEYPILYTSDFCERNLRVSRKLRCSGVILPETSDTLLRWIVETAFVTKAEYETLIRERDSLVKRLHDRPLVDRAKMSVMRRMHMTEEDAYQYLRSESMRLQIPMRELAQRLLQEETQADSPCPDSLPSVQSLKGESV